MILPSTFAKFSRAFLYSLLHACPLWLCSESRSSSYCFSTSIYSVMAAF